MPDRRMATSSLSAEDRSRYKEKEKPREERSGACLPQAGCAPIKAKRGDGRGEPAPTPKEFTVKTWVARPALAFAAGAGGWRAG